jgi:tetratricopeptide (TPR) repeat protein
MRHFFVLPVLAALIAIAPGTSISQNASDYDLCRDDDGEADARLLACSRIIDDARTPVDFRAEAYSNRGEVYANKGAYDTGIADETQALKLKANYAEAHNLRAWIFFKAGKPRDGLPDAEKAVSLQPASAIALDTRGHIYEALGKKDEAIADYRKAVLLDPELHESKDGLSRLAAQP